MTARSPLEVLLEVMKDRFDKGELDKAMVAARAAAPYVHGRVGAMRPVEGLAGVPDDELETWCGSDGAGPAVPDPE